MKENNYDDYVIKMDLETFVTSFEDYFQEVTDAVNSKEEWFKNLWERGADMEEFYELVQEISKKLNINLSLKTWSRAWDYRSILHDDYEEAKNEFVNAIFGWY